MTQDFSFKKGFNKELIAKKLNQGRAITSAGKVLYSFDGFEDWKSIALTALYRNTSISRNIAIRTIKNALFSKSLHDNFTSADFENECRNQYKIYILKPSRKYKVFFQITLSREPPARWLSATDCRIYFKLSKKSKFMRTALSHRNELYKKTYHKELHSSGTANLMPVVVNLEATNEAEAFAKARDGLDEILGLIDFFINRQTVSRNSFGLDCQQPVTNLRVGPFTTIHSPSGELASEVFWFVRNWQPPTKQASLKVGQQEIHQHIRKWNRLSRSTHDLSSEALSSLRQYHRALEQAEWHSAFLDLWTLLEFLTNIRNADYEKLVDRAAKMFAQYDEMREMGRHLRHRRNELVHAAEEPEDAEALIYQVKRLVEPLLLLYMRNGFRFRSRDEVAEFLDLPISTIELQKKRRLLQSVMSFRGYS